MFDGFMFSTILSGAFIIPNRQLVFDGARVGTSDDWVPFKKS